MSYLVVVSVCIGADEARLLQQLAAADASYPGGLEAYIRRSRKLLEDVKAGVNPFAGLHVAVPSGEHLVPGSSSFIAYEEEGLLEVQSCAFVFVAGGLGERLGYNGIKLSLPVESCTETSYIEYYCSFIRAFQEYAAAKTKKAVHIPLALMTSADTHDATVSLFKSKNFFGLNKEEVFFLQQQKVPALADMQARLATNAKDPFVLETKPHGHGDVHSLLLNSGLLSSWKEKGIKWVLLLQDTNANVMRVLMAVVGVSKRKNFTMNSIAVPRCTYTPNYHTHNPE